MKTAVFSTKPYVKEFFTSVNESYGHDLTFFKPNLNIETVPLVKGFDAVCIFVNDQADKYVICELARYGVKLIALRCAGFNNVDITEAFKNNIKVVRVPAYSPYSVAEHTLALLMGLNRKTHRAFNRVREGNFLLDGLMGFDLHGKTVGVIGTGKIGSIFAKIMNGLGCNILAYDKFPNDECENIGVKYISLNDIYQSSDIISLHCPLTPETHHIINSESLSQMKDGVVLLNTSRGALIDSDAVIDNLKSGKIGYLGLDVYEEEADLFFEDLSNKVIQDDTFARLLTFPNVLITGHQAFFTKEALQNITETTLMNIKEFELSKNLPHEVTMDLLK